MDWTQLRLNTAQLTPLYLQLCEAICQHVSSGDLRAGQQLPSERKLAQSLAVSRTTVVSAYHELEARGLVRTFVGRGTFVSGAPEPNTTESSGAPFAWRGKVVPAVQQHLDSSLRNMMHSATETISFGAGQPALEHFPASYYAARCQHHLTEDPGRALTLLPAEGLMNLREALAARHGVRPDNVLIVSGVQQAVSLIARCLLLPQDSVIVDYPGYVGALQAFRLTGASVVGWDITQADITELETLLLTKRPKLLFVHPSFQNPTGRTLNLATRQAVIELAKAYRVPVVEDMTYSNLYFKMPPPANLRELSGGGLVIQLHTFSKTLASGLRLGYIVADETIIDQLAFVKAQSDLHSPTLSQWVITDMLTSGVLDKHIATLRRIHARRADVLQRALRRQLGDVITWTAPNGGMYLWCSLSPRVQGGSRGLLAAAQAEGVTFALGENFFADGSGKRALRLCFSALSDEAIEEGINKLTKAVHTCLTST